MRQNQLGVSIAPLIIKSYSNLEGAPNAVDPSDTENGVCSSMWQN